MIPESMICVNGTEGNYIASVANFSASGDTVNEAIFNLQDIVSGTYHLLKTHQNLGPDMIRQKRFLDSYYEDSNGIFS